MNDKIIKILEKERKQIGKAIKRLILNAGNDSEIACNDLLNYSDILKKPLSKETLKPTKSSEKQRRLAIIIN